MQDYNNISLIIAGIALLSGIFLIIAPNMLIKAGEFFNRVYNVESTVYRKRIPFGIIYIVSGAILFYILW